MSALEKEFVNLIITGVGGQGNVLISRLIGEAFVKASYYVTIGETYGASQRGGAVASHIRISKDVQHSSIIPEGQANIILGLEPMESLRILGAYGSPNTFVITNTRPIHTMAVTIGEAEYPRLESIKQAINELSRKAWYIDASDTAMNLGAPVIANMVMLGALIGAELLPLTKDQVEQELHTNLRGERLTLNIEAFTKGLAETAKR